MASKKFSIGDLLLMVISLGLTFIVFEAGYRYHLHNKHPDRFMQDNPDQRPAVWFMERARWQFSEKYGYEYGLGDVYGGSADSGLVRSCWTYPVNAQGNMGTIVGDYNQAKLKVLVFGDSFTAQPAQGLTWPNDLQRILTEQYGQDVHVVNFGRDGYGILQMLDLAADKVAELKPHIVIFAFITDDFTRARFWRTATVKNGVERVLTTTVPMADPPMEKSADTAVIHSGATRAWCEAMVQSKNTDDPILHQMEWVVKDAQARSQLRVDPWTFSTSLLISRVRFGDPFATTTRAGNGSQNPRHTMKSYLEDEQFRTKAEALRQSGATIVNVHLTHHDEIKAGKDIIPGPQDLSLATSLGEALGSPVIWLRTKMQPPADLATICISPADCHPSRAGMEMYAGGVAKILAEKKLLVE